MAGSLTEGPWGARLLAALRALPREMREKPNASDNDFYQWTALPWEGWQAQEPTVTYLAAEYCRLATWDIDFPESLDSGPEGAEELYRAAADEAMALARLWLAYCYEEGRCGLPRKPEETVRPLAALREPVESVSLPELGFLYGELELVY